MKTALLLCGNHTELMNTLRSAKTFPSHEPRNRIAVMFGASAYGLRVNTLIFLPGVPFHRSWMSVNQFDDFVTQYVSRVLPDGTIIDLANVLDPSRIYPFAPSVTIL